jgi:pimeloyl-ACP methyl ester carboxylesterase
MTNPAQPESKFLSVNGLRLHYLDWGKPGASLILCIHGYTSSAEAFSGLARHFQDRFHFIVPDVRGHGESAWSPTGDYTLDDRVGDLEAIVDQLETEKFALIGTSMGGTMAMVYAGAHPERVARLVINDIGPDREPGSQRIMDLVARRPVDFATLEEAMAYRQQVSPGVASRTEADQRELALGVLRRRPNGHWIWKMDPAYFRPPTPGSPAPRPNLWPVLERLTCPTLVVWGTESDVLSEAQARRMVEVLPVGELVPIPRVTHAPALIEPVVLAALDRFLGGSG